VTFDVRSYASVDSTQDEAARLARAGARYGTVVVAREQTGGRGRSGRRWESPPGNVYLSAILRPGVPPARVPEIGLLAGIAVAEAIDEACGCRSALKWPNDVLVSGAKVSGILLENREATVILGIGINVRTVPEGVNYPAAQLGPELEPELVRASVLRRLEWWLGEWGRAGFGAVRQAWLERAHPVGTPLTITTPEALEGRFAGLDPSGALLLETAAGLRRIVAGDVAVP
jgi:BirA family transcriptional regulator, biotin operon repressor / biotin---[acetyl-CoA-carboxylase] ligase